jgi:hypothetical protein
MGLGDDDLKKPGYRLSGDEHALEVEVDLDELLKRRGRAIPLEQIDEGTPALDDAATRHLGDDDLKKKRNWRVAESEVVDDAPADGGEKKDE